MERIRIMQVIARMNVGGPAVLIAEMMRGLDSKQFDTQLYTGWCAEDEADFLMTQAQDVPAIRVPGLGRAIRPGEDVGAMRQLVRHIREFQPHIIHTHTAKAGVIGRLSARFARSSAKIVHTYHGHLLHGYFGPAKTRAVIETEKRLAKYSDSLIAVGATVRDDLVQAGIGRPDQFSIIPPGLTLNEIPRKQAARDMLGIPSGAFVVGFIGRLARIKRPDRMLDVVRTLQQSVSGLTVLVAGAGDDESLIQEAIAQEGLPIRMLGWRSDVENIYAACDAVLLTSDNEGMPVSLIQAGLAGIPVVSTDVGSVREIVKDNETGLLTTTEARELAESLRRLAEDPISASKLGDAARVWTTEQFGSNRIVSSHEDVYRRMLDAPNP